MTDQVIGAIIGASGAVTAAALAWSLNSLEKKWASQRYRRELGLSSLTSPLGKWKCEWFKKDGSLYVADEVTIEKWLKGGRFQGQGVQPSLSYNVEGEVDATRAVALTYRTTDFPTKAYVGVACLVFDQEGNELSGYWYGRARNGAFEGGETRWRRG
jgi:hypothetical protein